MSSRPRPPLLSRGSSLSRLGSSSSIQDKKNDGEPDALHKIPVQQDGLGEGLEEQMTKFVDDMTNVFTTLQKQCSVLRARRQALENDYTARCSDYEALNAEIEKLTAQRQALQGPDDHNPPMSHGWWDSTNRSSSTTPPLAPEGDVAGRLNRKIWVLEEQVKSLKGEKESTERAHQEAMEGEIAISAGLRDRIGDLEGKRRTLKLENESLEKKAKDLQSAVDEADRARVASKTRTEEEKRDLQDLLRQTRVTLETSQNELAVLKEENERIELDAKRMKEEAQLAQMVKSPPRVLQSREINIPLSQSPPPLTPTKAKPKGYPSLLASPSSRTSPTHELQRQVACLEADLAQLRNAYAHLYDTHQVLKKAHFLLRDTHKADIEHMKEYKKAQLAREEARKKRREEKKARAAREGRSVSVSASAAPPLSTSGQNDAAGDGLTSSGATVMADDGAMFDQVLVEESESLPKIVKRNNTQSGLPSSGKRQARKDESDQSIRHEGATQLASPSRPPRRPQSDSEPPHLTSTNHPAFSTPSALRNERRRAVIQPAHVTPWLGGSDRLPSTSSNRRLAASRSRDLDMARDEEVFASPPEQMPTPTVARTPLVRDRGVGGDVTSLRQMVMQKTMMQEVETPLKAATSTSQRHRHHSEAAPGSSTHTPASSSSKKRKIMDIDMEGLTPDQKAVKRKMLAQMPVSDRRELYKDYKGKGRYVRPEEVHTSVREEYEIDPEQNEGAAFAFHDVKRKRAERKQMHGGDCECCKDYYEAVGEIPRFNHGPVWRDEPVSTDASTRAEDAVREHQNRVSRHRETWTKPPTPPGYWKIGFPSTQDVLEQNEKADQMIADKEAKIRRETM
ncbi:hypothetical protein I317_01552 [Kwoniella heveanensis CBS 569]|nr:hypothetical protein I317_01552 [Kwoniella heveanensis CBS 569]